MAKVRGLDVVAKVTGLKTTVVSVRTDMARRVTKVRDLKTAL